MHWHTSLRRIELQGHMISQWGCLAHEGRRRLQDVGEHAHDRDAVEHLRAGHVAHVVLACAPSTMPGRHGLRAGGGPGGTWHSAGGRGPARGCSGTRTAAAVPAQEGLAHLRTTTGQHASAGATVGGERGRMALMNTGATVGTAASPRVGGQSAVWLRSVT